MSTNKIIKKIRYSSNLGFWIALILHKIYVFLNYRLKKDEYYIQKSYKKIFGYDLDLKTPNTLNEKMQWYKLNFKHPLIVKCADKFEVREYFP